jgi:hypothetical protein
MLGAVQEQGRGAMQTAALKMNRPKSRAQRSLAGNGVSARGCSARDGLIKKFNHWNGLPHAPIPEPVTRGCCICSRKRPRGDVGGRISAMSRRPARCTQADINRALKAVVQSGADMVVEVTADGAIRISRNTAVPRSTPVPVESGPEPVLW